MRLNKADFNLRILEVVPGFLSWGIIIAVALFAIRKPVVAAVVILTFDFLWIIRSSYFTCLLLMARRELFRHKNKDWLYECRQDSRSCSWETIYHLVIFPVYKEGYDILRASLEAVKNSDYPPKKIVVVVSFEERLPEARQTAARLESEFQGAFFSLLITFHPQGLAGELPVKSANSNWAARHAKDFFAKENIPSEKVIVSCFDADTCPEKEYFSCLTYTFLRTPKPHQASYQPVPVYNNNIWQSPSFARIVELTTSFNQMIESMRLEKFVTFSSHSMSFKTLIDIDYWPADMVSDDSLIFWKAYLFFKGDYRVLPLYVTVSMDVAYSNTILKTMALQYRQKRRWAWGVENFPYVVNGFIKDKDIAVSTKFRKAYNLLESHVTWAIWAVMTTLLPSLVVFFGGNAFVREAIGYNFSRVSGMLFNFAAFAGIALILLSRTMLPPRPPEVKWGKNIIMFLEWLLVPIIVLFLGSTPALDAQTRMMFGKRMGFNTTEKKRS